MADIDQTPESIAQTTGRDEPEAPAGKPEEYFPRSGAGEDTHVFEIALVLGGTVSVGAYTAGVLDFLFEALDQWEHHRSESGGVPEHRVRVRIFTGTSGGGISSLLCARALHYSFPPASSTTAKQQLASNPFYSVWVDAIDITSLLDTSDLEMTNGSEPPIKSILNGDVLQRIASSALQYPQGSQVQNGPVTPLNTARAWVTNPLPIVVTHTNLAGVPYSQSFKGNGISAEYFENHADFMRLYVGFHGTSTYSSQLFLPEAVFLDVPYGPSSPAIPAKKSPVSWSDIAQNALGTSAFPIGLPARVVHRNGADYACRFVWDESTGRYDWIQPLWGKLNPSGVTLEKYTFTSLDGGCTDNEPIELASHVLEGLASRRAPRPSEKERVDRAIILVDPLCEAPELPAVATVPALVDLLAPAAHMLVSANRFATADIADFLHPSDYSRFIIAPKRSADAGVHAATGGEALCGDGLGAFLGFMSHDFRHHDFMLGRRNCQAFLSGTFTLSAKNPVFGSNKPVFSNNYKGPKPPTDEVPIVPLLGSAVSEQPQPDWPAGAFDADSLRDLVTRRVDLLLSRASAYLGMNPAEHIAYLGAVKVFIGPLGSRKVIEAIKSELKRKELG